MRLGGFVIHGNSAATLPACLDSLLSVCDEVVAVDSCSDDGSAAIVESRGVRRIVQPWLGYGKARAVAAAALAHCDYVTFLDSDEKLASGAVEHFAAWRASGPGLPHYKLRRQDVAELPGRRFVFRTEHHVRIIRRDATTWLPEMIVHEALPDRPFAHMPAIIEHRWVTRVDELVGKQERYALLWALRAANEGRRPRSTFLRRPAHVVRNCLLKGALFRGGTDAVRLAWDISLYHSRKHELLREVLAGRHADKLQALRDGRLDELYR